MDKWWTEQRRNAWAFWADVTTGVTGPAVVFVLLSCVLAWVVGCAPADAQSPADVKDARECYTVSDNQPGDMLTNRTDAQAVAACITTCAPGTSFGVAVWTDMTASCACLVFRDFPVVFEPLPGVHR